MALVSVVVPVYYNEVNIPDLYPRLKGLAGDNPEHQFEYVFVDDGSGDNSFDVLRELADRDEDVRVVKLSRNFGSSAAILAGLAYASGDCRAVIAADLQDPPELISTMLRKWEGGTKVVLAARSGREDPLHSRLLAEVFYWLFRRFALKDMPREGFDFFLIDRQVAELLVRMGERNAYVMGQILWLGFDREVIHYRRKGREKGESRWTFWKKLKYFIDAFASFSYLPLRLASTLGLVLAALGGLYALLVVGLRLLNGISVPGWSALMVTTLLVSGAQLVILGIIGEYLWRVLDEARRRPPFVVRSLVNLDPSPHPRLERDIRIDPGSER